MKVVDVPKFAEAEQSAAPDVNVMEQLEIEKDVMPLARVALTKNEPEWAI